MKKLIKINLLIIVLLSTFFTACSGQGEAKVEYNVDYPSNWELVEGSEGDRFDFLLSMPRESGSPNIMFSLFDIYDQSDLKKILESQTKPRLEKNEFIEILYTKEIEYQNTQALEQAATYYLINGNKTTIMLEKITIFQIKETLFEIVETTELHENPVIVKEIDNIKKSFRIK